MEENKEATKVKDDNDDMDAILHAALDELEEDDDDDDDEDEITENIKTTQQQQQQQSNSDDSTKMQKELKNCPDGESAFKEEMEELNSMMKKALQDDNDDSSLNEFINVLQQQVSKEMTSIQEEEQKQKNDKSSNSDKNVTNNEDVKSKKTNNTVKTPPSSNNNNAKEEKKRPVFGPEPPPLESDVERTISKLLNEMNSSSASDEEKIIKELEQGLFNEDDGEEGCDAMIEGMMQQLLTKDLMYEPIQQVTLKYPKWLEGKKNTLTEKEYADRCKQLECLRALMKVYETEPENSEKLMDLMKDVQEYGLPPEEIIAEIAPNLELGEDGVPKLSPLEEGCSIM
eukprot:CAMPEP_0194173080 /NCGR_PEP_ID=MMETSP0154-20130528/7463_1 /TAXON_ID=1049557 /ORGANISM="Thalassiothrix antarctica, Strain L6-D1" /LENGTH=341 /DNA_ID=CAMNT_0038886001 /DNA_START=59 /DNA_END=1084 /DNA_ORIENTATION=+